MTDAVHQREQASLAQLGAVSQARQIRLRSERTVLAERERVLAEATAAQEMDEALLTEQQKQWSTRWQAWARSGGELRAGMGLRHDRDLLRDMALLVARQRAALQVQADRLSQELDAWTLRWRGAQALDESLAARERALRISVERATERQRDEDTLMSRPSGLDASTALTAHR